MCVYLCVNVRGRSGKERENFYADSSLLRYRVHSNKQQQQNCKHRRQSFPMKCANTFSVCSSKIYRVVDFYSYQCAPRPVNTRYSVKVQNAEYKISARFLPEVVVAFFLACEDLGECSINHSPPTLFFFFKVEISSRTLIPLFRPGASRYDCG